MLPTRNPLAPLAEWGDLVLIQLANWRWSWRGALLTGLITPLFGIAALGLFARPAGPEALRYVLSGNVVISLMFGTLGRVCSNFAYMRLAGSLDYFATLPIRRGGLVLATVAAFFLLALPAVLVTLGVGAWWLDVPLAIHPLLFLVIPVSAVPLAALGALIGTATRTPTDADTWSLLLTLALAGIGPVAVPPDRLPGVLLAVGRLSPATYAADALRQVLFGPVTADLALDLGVLCALAVAILALVTRLMDWRQR
jgi:ABC-2 type transport system permease protein